MKLWLMHSMELQNENGGEYEDWIESGSKDGSDSISIAVALRGRNFDEHVTHRHLLTFPLDHNGQGNAHVCCLSAHRAVVDVDQELGLVNVVEIATSQMLDSFESRSG